MKPNFRTYWKQLTEEAVQRRKEQHMTQAKLAALADISKPTVVKFENGNMGMTIKKAMRILKVLNLD